MAFCSTAPTSTGEIILPDCSAPAKQQNSLFNRVCCCLGLQVVQPSGTEFPAAIHCPFLEQGMCNVRLLRLCHLILAMIQLTFPDEHRWRSISLLWLQWS